MLHPDQDGHRHPGGVFCERQRCIFSYRRAFWHHVHVVFCICADNLPRVARSMGCFPDMSLAAAQSGRTVIWSQCDVLAYRVSQAVE